MKQSLQEDRSELVKKSISKPDETAVSPWFSQPPSSKEPSFVQDTDQEKLVTHIHEKEKIKITIHTVEKCSTNQSPLPPPAVVDTNNHNNNNQIEDIPRKDVVVHHQEESNDEIRLVTNTVKIIPVNQEKLNRRKRKYTDERCEDPASGRSVPTANEGDKIPTDNSNINATIHQTIYNETLVIDQSKLDLVEHLKPNDEEMHSTSSPSSVVGQLSQHHQQMKPQQEQSPTEQPHINISNKSTKKHKKKKKHPLEAAPEQTTETGTTDVHCESTPGLVRSELNDIAMLVDEECLIKASEETVILENYYQENVTLTTTTSSMNSTQPENENTGEAVKVMAKPKSPLSNNNTEVHFTGLVSSMSPMTSVSAMSMSIDSGHSGSNDTTLSLVERTTLETDTSYTTMSVSPQVFDGSSSRISTPSSTSTSAMMVPESNQPSKWLSSDEVGVGVVPQKHGDSCVGTSHDQKIPKQEVTGKMDSHPDDEFIQKSVIQSYAVHTIKHDFVNSVNDGTTVSPIENRETPESLIIPRIINSMSTKTPQEFDRDTEPAPLSTKLSEIEIAPTQVVSNQLSKKESKKSKKKHQKIDKEINKTVDADFSTTDNFDQMISIPESPALSVEEEKWRQESSSLQATVVEHFQQTIVLNTSMDEVKIHPTDTTMCEVDGEDLELGVSVLPATDQASKKESKKSKKKHHKINEEIDKTVDLDFNTTDSFDQMISIPESTAQTVKEAEWQELNLPDCQTSLQAPVVEHFQKTVVNTSMNEMKIHPIDDTVHVVDIQSDISTLPVVTEIDSTPIVVNQELKKESKKSKKKHQKGNQAVDKTVDLDFITTDNFDQMMSTPESTVQPVEEAKWQELSSTNSQTSLQTPVEEHFQQTIVLTTSMSEMKVHPTDDTVSDLSLQSGISMLPQTELDPTPVGNLSSKKESKKNKKKHQKTSEEIIDKTVVPDFITTDNFDQMISLPETSLQVPILKPSNQIADKLKLYPMDTTMSDAAAGEHLQSDVPPMLQKSIKPTTVAGLKTTPSIEKLSDEIQISFCETTTVITETNQPKASKNINKSTKPTKSSIQSSSSSVPTKIHGELGDAVNQLLQLHDPELLNTQTNNQSSSSLY
ncbi:unnamed protein product [Trichobilharzia szidati]|nr:unnamed protein product [Trichobilharzia szidati]